MSWDDWDDQYWFELAETRLRRPLWPRRCEATDRLLWWTPAVRGETSYYMRSGSKRYDIRWMDPKTFTEQKLKYKGQ